MITIDVDKGATIKKIQRPSPATESTLSPSMPRFPHSCIRDELHRVMNDAIHVSSHSRCFAHLRLPRIVDTENTRRRLEINVLELEG